MFVPFQKPDDAICKTPKEKYFARAMMASMISFLLAVVAISYTTNKYEAKLREATATTCHAGNPPSSTQSVSHK
jgi:hypothetical protein